MPKQQPEVLPPGTDNEIEVPMSASTLSAIEEGDRRSMIAAAKANPRSLVVFRKELDELVSISETVAAEMTYSLPRGDKQLIGPSIRFAEAVVYCYRNLRAGVEVIDVGDSQLTAEGRVYDAERNSGIAIRVNRNITGRNGRFNQDMIGVTGNAASSIAYRNAVLRYVPKALWIESWEKAKQVTIGGAETIGKKRTDAMGHFNAMGVTDVQVFNTLGVRGVEDIKTDELVALKAYAREIKAGARSIEDIFGSPLDEEIERAMKELGWNETTKRLSRTSFAGNREGHLAHLKTELGKMGKAVPETKEKPAKAKAEPKPEPATEVAAEAKVEAQSTEAAEAATKVEQEKPAQTPKKAIPADW